MAATQLHGGRGRKTRIPGFTASRCVLAIAGERAERYTEWDDHLVDHRAAMQRAVTSNRIPEFTALGAIRPAIADERASRYMECVRECRGEGGTASACRETCGGQGTTPEGHGAATGGSGAMIYGNYCGPGWGDETGATAPVDAVDAACRAHDLCYAATNYFNCGCDRALLYAMPGAIAAAPSAAGKAAGAAVMAHFAGQPCVCPSWACIVAPFACVGVGGHGAIC